MNLNFNCNIRNYQIYPLKIQINNAISQGNADVADVAGVADYEFVK